LSHIQTAYHGEKAYSTFEKLFQLNYTQIASQNFDLIDIFFQWRFI